MQRSYGGIFFCTSILLLSPLSVAANSLLIYGLCKSRQLQNASNKLIVLMCISDLCQGMFVLPALAISRVPGASVDQHVINAFTLLSYIFIYTSIQIIICIAVDRYIHVTRSNLFQWDIKNHRLAILVVFCLVNASGIAVLCMIPIFWLFLAISVCNSLVFSVLSILYVVMYRRLKQHQTGTPMLPNNSKTNGSERNSNKNDPDSNSNKNDSEHNSNKNDRENNCNNNDPEENSNRNNPEDNSEKNDPERKCKRLRDVNAFRVKLSAIKTIRLVIASMFICYIPYNVIYPVRKFYVLQLNRQPSEMLKLLATLSAFLVFCSTVIDSIIIIYGNARCRRAVSLLFRKTAVTNG